MANTTEISEKDLNRKGFLKFVNVGVILSLLSSCIPDDRDGIMPTQLRPSPNPDAPTSVPIEEDLSELPDGIEEIAPTPTATEIIPQYTLTPEIKNFRDSYIPVEELLDGSYYRWLKDTVAPILVPWFQEHEEKIKDVTLDSVDIPSGKVIIFNISTLPNFEDPETAPFKRDVTFGFTSSKETNSILLEYIDGDSLLYRILPVFYYDKETDQVHPVITVEPTFIKDEEEINKINRQYLEDMNITIIHMNDTLFDIPYSLVNQSFNKIGRDDMRDRMLRFLHDADFSALSGEGIILLTEVLKARIYK